MSFEPLSAEDLAKADVLRRLTRYKGSAKTERDVNIQMAIHGAAQVLVTGANNLFSQRRLSTLDSYEGSEDLPEAHHMTNAIANLSQDIDKDIIKEDAPRSMMRWIVSDVLTQAQALRISIGAAHPQVIHCLSGDERVTAEIAVKSEDLRANLDLQKNGNYGAMNPEAQEDIRMDIESDIHITGQMQNEIDRQGMVMDRLGFIRSNPGPRLALDGNAYNDAEQQTGGIVANYEYGNVSTGNPSLDKAIRSTSIFAKKQDGEDAMVLHRISTAQTMVAHEYSNCQAMDANQLSQRILSMYELVSESAKHQYKGETIILIRGDTTAQSALDTSGITTFEFDSMTPRGRDAMNQIIDGGDSLSTHQKMGLSNELQKLENAKEVSRNLPVVTKKSAEPKRASNDSLRTIRQPGQQAEPKQESGFIQTMRGAFDSLTR